MSTVGDRLFRSRGTAIFVALFIASAALASGLSATWAREMRQPRVTLLGSGKALSVLVTAGQSRLLLATGDDPVGFGNALSQVRRLTTPRIDILIIAGRGQSLLVPIEARRTVRPRYVASVATIPPSPERDALGTDVAPLRPGPHLIDLGSGVTVEVEVGTPGGDSEKSAVPWRLIVRRGTTTVVVLSDGDTADQFPELGPVAAYVVAGGGPPAGVDGVTTKSLVMPATETSGKALRQELRPSVRETLWTVRVYPGEVVRLDFVTGGLRLPADATAIEPSPAPAGMTPALLTG